MNYIAEIMAFYDFAETNPITLPSISLWHALMYQANKTGWRSEFSVAISTLELRTGLKRSAIYRARNILRQLGIIDFKERPGNQSSVYTINSLCLFKGHKAEHKADTKRNTKRTQSGTQAGTINKQNKTKHNTPLTSPRDDIEDRFKVFWEAYPRRVAKANAVKVWERLKPSQELLEAMLEAIDKAKTSANWQEGDGKYIPYPATWLNGKRWLDEMDSSLAETDRFKDVVV